MEDDNEDENAIEKLIKEKQNKKNKDSSEKKLIKAEAILPDNKKKVVNDSTERKEE